MLTFNVAFFPGHCEKLWRVDSSNYSFRAANTQFVALGLDGKQFQSPITVAKDQTIGEKCEIIRKADDLNRVRIKGPNGFFWQVCVGNFLFLSRE